MSATRIPIKLFNRAQNAFEDAELHEGISEANLTDWQNQWIPAQEAAMRALIKAGRPARSLPDTNHWNWRAKVEVFKGLLSNPSFSISCAGVTQGLMILDTVKKLSRLEEPKKPPLVYPEYIQTAPWNRKGLVTEPIYSGVGSILLKCAIQTSLDLEYKGRIGLHSVPNAEAFYANHCNMTDLGPDSGYHNMRYFEMTPIQAQAFLKKGET